MSLRKGDFCGRWYDFHRPHSARLVETLLFQNLIGGYAPKADGLFQQSVAFVQEEDDTALLKDSTVHGGVRTLQVTAAHNGAGFVRPFTHHRVIPCPKMSIRLQFMLFALHMFC